MRRGSDKQSAAQKGFANQVRPNANANNADGNPSDAAIFLQSLKDPTIVERVRATILNAHVFKLPPKQSASVGWRGADWKEKVWQGTLKVVERGDLTAVLLVDRSEGSTFAVCPVKEGAVDRCVDSSRYFVLRIENANGRHMFIGLAFNERNDSFDFNTSLEDSKREREQEKNPVKVDFGPRKDYSIKEGEKIKVAIPKFSASGSGRKSSQASGRGKSFLKPSSRDTPSRECDPVMRGHSIESQPRDDSNPKSAFGSSFFDAEEEDPFPFETFSSENNFFEQNTKK
mmetsp:Transcript_688/g.967  ORF Transcript_688/g.967 Transcript_688/m.967 type:complete len:286 (-) Transcript_688:2169-3026(-)